MQTFKFTVAYDGSRYDGWQKQGNTGATIQGKLEGVLAQLVQAPVEIHGAGRTDAGVHARGQTASCTLAGQYQPEQLMDYFNRYLPEDIAVTGCAAVEPRFHARLSAKGKRYIYRLWNSDVPNVFQRKYLTPWPHPLDLEAMVQGAAHLTGAHDFRAFCANKRYKKSTLRTVTAIDVTRLGDEVRLTFTGTGFLHNMVRILAGTLVEVGMGEREADSLPAVLESRDRANAGRTLPARGLILDQVFY